MYVKSLWEVPAQELGQFWSWERSTVSFHLQKSVFVLYANLAVIKFISLLTYQSISEFRNPPFSLSLSIDCRALNPHNNIPPPTYLSNHWPTLVAHKVSACQWTYKLCSYKNSWMGGLAVTFHWDTFLRQHHHHHGTSHKDWTGERVYYNRVYSGISNNNSVSLSLRHIEGRWAEEEAKVGISYTFLR